MALATTLILFLSVLFIGVASLEADSIRLHPSFLQYEVVFVLSPNSTVGTGLTLTVLESQGDKWQYLPYPTDELMGALTDINGDVYNSDDYFSFKISIHIPDSCSTPLPSSIGERTDLFKKYIRQHG